MKEEKTVMTLEQFELLFKLDPEANKNQMFAYVERHLKSSMTTFQGDPMDFDFIYTKFKAYSDWWDRKHGSKDPKYLAKTDKKKGIIVFISDGMYDSNFGLGKNPRDFYMLGNMSFEIFSSITEKFQDVLNTRGPDKIVEAINQFKNNLHGTKQPQKVQVDKSQQASTLF
jgi:hypothetical protein